MIRKKIFSRDTLGTLATLVTLVTLDTDTLFLETHLSQCMTVQKKKSRNRVSLQHTKKNPIDTLDTHDTLVTCVI